MKPVVVPALDIDKVLYLNGRPHPEGVLERRIVANLIAHADAAGFKLHSVYDGDTTTRVADTKAAMELIFNLDEVSLRFIKGGFTWHGVLLVLGNGIDVVSDWNYSDGDKDGFNACMDAFDAEQFA